MAGCFSLCLPLFLLHILCDGAKWNFGSKQQHAYICLHLIFIPRINFALEEFTRMFNDHKIRSACNMSPNQLWTNGMLDPNNPLSRDMLDEPPDNLDLYAEDVHGPTPFEESDNNVVVEPVHIEESELIARRVLQEVDPLMNSTEIGIDIFRRGIQIAEQD